jgi:hypothetical protein
MGSGSFGSGHHFVGGHIGRIYGYSEDWMARTKKTIEDELRYRGIAPEVTTRSSARSKSRRMPCPFCWPS